MDQAPPPLLPYWKWWYRLVGGFLALQILLYYLFSRISW